jgi:hypothetical protein
VTVAAPAHLDAASAAFVRDVLAAVDAEVPVVEGYVIGSGAVGPFDPATSDIDLVAVVERPLGAARGPLLDRLRQLRPPGRELELVVYVRGEQPPDYELNLDNGVERPDEDPHWFVLDAAVAQERAAPVWGDRPWTDLFDLVPPEVIRVAMQQSLAWAERQRPDNEFARVHKIRARHYLDHGQWISKAEAQA